CAGRVHRRERVRGSPRLDLRVDRGWQAGRPRRPGPRCPGDGSRAPRGRTGAPDARSRGCSARGSGARGVTVSSHELARFDAVGQAELVRRGEVSPAELLEAAVERIEALNPVINAV